MSHPILERHLEGGTLKPLYLLFGEEDFLRERAVRRLEKALEAKAGGSLAKVIREASETSLEEFLSQARVSSLFGESQLLLLRRVELYPPQALAPVAEYLTHPAPRSLVVFTAPGLKAREVENHPVFGRLLREEMALGFFRLREAEILPWLVQEARSLGKTLTPAAAQRLLEVVGDNLADLHQELKKLALYAGNEPLLTPQQVNQLATHSRPYTIFALVEALGESSAQRRLAALHHLLELGEPPARILTMLARQVRLLLRYLEISPTTSEAELSQRLGLPPGLLKRLGQQAQRFSPESLKSHLKRLHRIDLALKTGTAHPRLWLEWLLLNLGPG